VASPRFSRFLGPLAITAAGVLGLGACFAIAPHGIHRQTDTDAGEGGGIDLGDAMPPENLPPDADTLDPHAVVGAEPSHGPFAGGQRVLIHGKGFSSKARVWFGSVEADHATLIPIDPSRLQIAAPAGKAGPVDVSVQNADDASTKRTLKGGYSYDALYAEPDTGPVPGGTVIELIGQDTHWDATTVAKIDQKACTTTQVLTPTLLNCTVPAGTPGSKTIAVTTGQESIVVLDGYTYEDSDNGYKGGLSGNPIAGSIEVLVYDNYTGAPIPGAHVVLGSTIGKAILGQTDGSGVAVIKDPSLTGPVTVTVAGTCHSPITFIDDPVDKVTAYLDPVLSPACAGMGDPPPVGGKPSNAGEVTGQLVWPSMGEFKKGLWANVPQIKSPNEARTAYVFYAVGDPTYAFQLPSAVAAITEATPGDLGYQFALGVPAGDRALYALAGIEDRSVSPPKFTAYAMGLVKGVPVIPGNVTDSVYIAMDKTLDQALSMNVMPPPPGPKGPDRLRATVAIMLGNDGYALLPAGQKAPLLPVQGLLPFVGVPSLDGTLAGSSYLSTAKAVTGPTNSEPLSVISRIISTTTSQVVQVDNFVNIPTLMTPGVNGAWDGTHLAANFAPGGSPIDITVYDVLGGNGLVHWLVAVPKGSNAVEVPDLSGWPDSALPPGPLTIDVYGGRVTGFDYAKLLYRWLHPTGMTAYSLDSFAAHL
jgi:IPT/TIG domain